MKIFIVNGIARSGKDTFEKMVIDCAAAHDDDVGKLSIIDYIKETATENYGYKGIKNAKERKFLCDLKNVLAEWDDIPYRELQRRIYCCYDAGMAAIFIDSREKEDIERLVKDYNATTILVDRYDEPIKYGNKADDSIETNNYDIYINNHRGLDELRQEAEIFYEIFIEEDES